MAYISDPDGLETVGGNCFTLRQMFQEERCIENFLSAAFERGIIAVILHPTELLWTFINYNFNCSAYFNCIVNWILLVIF